MYQIALCDDETLAVDKLEKLILKYGTDNNVECQIRKFYSGEDLIRSEINFDLIFLDIEMNGMSGIEAAEQIRKNDMDTPIVYVTSYTDYSMQAHKVHAFDFIEKPFNYNEIKKVLTDFMQMNDKQQRTVIELKTDNSVIFQDMDDVIYIMITNRRELYMYVNSQKEAVIIKGALSEIFSRLDKKQFFMPHKSYIVNIKFVKAIKNYYDIVMSNGDVVPLSQRKREMFKAQVHNYISYKGAFK